MDQVEEAINRGVEQVVEQATSSVMSAVEKPFDEPKKKRKTTQKQLDALKRARERKKKKNTVIEPGFFSGMLGSAGRTLLLIGLPIVTGFVTRYLQQKITGAMGGSCAPNDGCHELESFKDDRVFDEVDVPVGTMYQQAPPAPVQRSVTFPVDTGTGQIFGM